MCGHQEAPGNLAKIWRVCRLMRRVNIVHRLPQVPPSKVLRVRAHQDGRLDHVEQLRPPTVACTKNGNPTAEEDKVRVGVLQRASNEVRACTFDLSTSMSAQSRK